MNEKKELEKFYLDNFNIDLNISDEEYALMKESKWDSFVDMLNEIKKYLAVKGGSIEVCDNALASKLGFKTLNDDDGEVIWQQPVSKMGTLPDIIKTALLTTEGKENLAKSLL